MMTPHDQPISDGKRVCGIPPKNAWLERRGAFCSDVNILFTLANLACASCALFVSCRRDFCEIRYVARMQQKKFLEESATGRA
jgi:hypothetical protein